jgi:hypothetical protein
MSRDARKMARMRATTMATSLMPEGYSSSGASCLVEMTSIFSSRGCVVVRLLVLFAGTGCFVWWLSWRRDDGVAGLSFGRSMGEKGSQKGNLVEKK